MSLIEAILEEAQGEEIDEGLVSKIYELDENNVKTYVAALAYAQKLPQVNTLTGSQDILQGEAHRRVCRSLRIGFIGRCFFDVHHDMMRKEALERFQALDVPESLVASLLHAVARSEKYSIIPEKKHVRAKRVRILRSVVTKRMSEPAYIVVNEPRYVAMSEPAYVALRSDFWRSVQ